MVHSWQRMTMGENWNLQYSHQCMVCICLLYNCHLTLLPAFLPFSLSHCFLSLAHYPPLWSPGISSFPCTKWMLTPGRRDSFTVPELHIKVPSWGLCARAQVKMSNKIDVPWHWLSSNYTLSCILPRETINQVTTISSLYITALLAITESVPKEFGWINVFII